VLLVRVQRRGCMHMHLLVLPLRMAVVSGRDGEYLRAGSFLPGSCFVLGRGAVARSAAACQGFLMRFHSEGWTLSSIPAL